MSNDNNATRQLLQDTMVTSLETMAFFCCEPAQGDALSPEDAISVEMKYTGPTTGVVQIVASRFFGQRLASNVLCCGVTDEDAVSRAEDSIRELINVVVGALMPRIAHDKRDVYNLSLPTARAFDTATEWDGFAKDPSACFIDAEGETLALRLKAA